MLQDVQKNFIEKEITSLVRIQKSKGKSASTFKLRDRLLGSTKSHQDPVVLTDPKTNKVVTTPQEIKRVSLAYAVDLLKNREPKKEFIDVIKHKEELHQERLKEIIPDDLDELPEDPFDKTLKQISEKPGNKYEFIKKAGYSYIQALYQLFSTVWKTEKIPNKWHESTLTQLFKPGKKDVTNLNNFRHIHNRQELSKFFTLMVINIAKEKILKNMSKYQIANRPGHRSSEHIFAVKHAISYYREQKKPLILSSFDLEKFFDSERLEDCQFELYKLDIKGKVYRLVSELNSNTQIKVKTPLGKQKLHQLILE